jgi:hypothetical protein
VTFHVKRTGETKLETRVCTQCERERPLVLFPPKNKFGHKGIRSFLCQGCLDTRRRERRVYKKSTSKRGVTVTRKAKQMWAAARLRAWRQRLPFTLTEEWIADRLQIGRCEVTGLEFDGIATGDRTAFTPSIDREMPEQGYTPNNCRMVVWGYNSAKGAGTHDDVMVIARALVTGEVPERELARIPDMITSTKQERASEGAKKAWVTRRLNAAAAEPARLEEPKAA